METAFQIREFDPVLDIPPAEVGQCGVGKGVVRSLLTGAAPGWGGPCTGSVKTVILSNGVKLPVRENIAELVARLSEETMRRGYKFVPGWCWGYSCRKIRGSSTWSNHAWALAVDINAPKNPHKRPLTTDMPAWMWALWEAYGFRWGGKYSKPDTMHYEFMGNPKDAARFTEQARQLGGKPPAPIQEDEDVAVVIADAKGWYVTNGVYKRALSGGNEVEALFNAKVIVSKNVTTIPQEIADAIPEVKRGGFHLPLTKKR